MTDDFDRILDECIDRINRGEDPAACLSDHAEYAEELSPLLQTVVRTKQAHAFAPSASAKREARRRFTTALAESRRMPGQRQPLLSRLSAWRNVWATAAAVVLIVVVGYFGLKPVLSPTGTPTETVQPSETPVTEVGQEAAAPAAVVGQEAPSSVLQPQAAGNFVFLISDEVNAISEFKSLDISVAQIGLHLEGEGGGWIELAPLPGPVNLTLLQGDEVQEIWRGDVPEGSYSKVFIRVADVRGVLIETGQEVTVRLPSDKLQISKPFEVSAGAVTSFVYDVTVTKAGSAPSGYRFILKPQVGESTVEQVPED